MEVPNELVQRLNTFLRDNPILNTLIEGKESSPAQLRMAIEDSLDDWNTTPPPLAYVTYTSHPSRRLLIRGAVIEILDSAGILQSRNKLSYNDGGISVQISDKGGDYMQWINKFTADYERKKMEVKKTININLGWGEAPSEYALISGDRFYLDT